MTCLVGFECILKGMSDWKTRFDLESIVSSEISQVLKLSHASGLTCEMANI